MLILYLLSNMKYLAMEIKKVFLRFAFISAVFCIPNVNFISEIDVSKSLASKKSLNYVQKNSTCLHSQNR